MLQQAVAVLLVLVVGVHALGPVVDISGLGKVRGRMRLVRDFAVDEFLGVKYAEGPRWESPVPVAPWSDTKDAVEYGATCPGSLCVRDLKRDSEDCLFLNIYRAAKMTEKVPVMVWIHGGGYTSGCSDMYQGEELVARADGKVVVVTINYRLNVFGFLGSDQLRAKDGSTGNFGFQDQRAAIQWVKDHISAFGGDASRITIFGESAGAGSVACHLTSLRTPQGFFQRAIAESGLGALWDANPLSKAEENFNHLLKRTDCSDVACLRGKTTKQLQEGTRGMNVSMISEVYLTWAPTIDNVEFSKSPLKSFDEGDYLRNVSVMAGTNRDEMAFFMFFDTKMSELMFEAMMLPLLKSPLDLYELKRLYRNESYDYPAELGEYNWWWWATMRAQTDQHFTCPSRRAVRGLAQHAESVYVYLFVHPTKTQTIIPATGPKAVAVPHASDLPYVFNCAGFPLQSSCHFSNPVEAQLARNISGFWSSFGTGSAPAPEWPLYNPTTDLHYVLDVPQSANGTGFHTMTNFRKAQCDFWDRMMS